MPSLTGDARKNREKFAWRGLRRPRCCGAVDTPGIAVVDLGLSGSDFSELKARYGLRVCLGQQLPRQETKQSTIIFLQPKPTSLQ